MTVQISTLSNGLRVVSEHMPGLQSAALGLWVTAGGRHERVEQNGIAHFLEHMAFKGTTTRSALQIAEAIEDVGGYINAYTSREVTAYYARVLKADTALAVDVLADILLNPVFDTHEIETERHVILQEIGQAHDTPDDVIFDWLQAKAYPDQPIGRTILGEMGAEQLLGMGDMLYMAGGAKITRCHGPFVSDEEVEEIVNHLKSFGAPDYVGGVVEGPDDDKASNIDAVLGLSTGGNTDAEDALYDTAVQIVIKDRKCSTSYIQRKLAIGYNKAARLVEQMEDEGLVSPANHVGKREILVPEPQ